MKITADQWLIYVIYPSILLYLLFAILTRRGVARRKQESFWKRKAAGDFSPRVVLVTKLLAVWSGMICLVHYYLT